MKQNKQLYLSPQPCIYIWSIQSDEVILNDETRNINIFSGLSFNYPKLYSLLNKKSPPAQYGKIDTILQYFITVLSKTVHNILFFFLQKKIENLLNYFTYANHTRTLSCNSNINWAIILLYQPYYNSISTKHMSKCT